MWANVHNAVVNIMTRNYNEMERDLAAVSNKMAVTFLRISQTQIVELKRYILHDFTNLTDLDLSNCSICSFEDGVFESLKCLRSLNLSSNVINVINGELFATNSELLTINLTNNIIDTINQISFSNLNKLLILDLSYNQISGLQDHCFSNPNLKYLYLNDNQIVNVAPSAFYSVPNLTYLSLDHNKIEYFENGVFQNTINLKYLSLNNNKIYRISHGFFWNLTQLSTLHMRNNCLTQAMGESLLATNTELVELDLSGNLICTVERGAFSGCKKLKSIHLSCGYFKVSSIKDLNLLTNFELTYTQSEHQFLYRGYWDTFKYRSQLTVLKLIFHKIDILSFCRFYRMINLEYLHIEIRQPSDHIRDIQLTTIFNGMSKLKQLILKKLNYFTISGCNYKQQRLTYLDITGVKLDLIKNNFRKLVHLTYLNLSFSNIKILSKNAFQYLINLEHLELQHSQFRYIYSELFKFNDKLITLNCSNCNIHTIEEYSFINLRNLLLFDLRNNCINDITDNTFLGLNILKCNIRR